MRYNDGKLVILGVIVAFLIVSSASVTGLYFFVLNNNEEPVINVDTTEKIGIPTEEENGSEEICLTSEEYEKGYPILSMPFKLEDYYPKSWGIVPFCADPWESGNVHNAIDFELKPNSKVYAAAGGKVTKLSYSDIEGAGEIMEVQGDGFTLDYSGLLNIRLGISGEMKRGDYIADVYETPFGEYHVHLGIVLDKGAECPIKYMDKEFKDALKEMFAQAHYLRQDEQPCACNCEYLN